MLNQKKYPGISSKKLHDGTIAIMVRFKYLGKSYPVKNFTKLFGCKTQKSAYDKLNEVKTLLSKNIDPFNPQGKKLDDYFFKKVEKNKTDGSWRENTIKSYVNFYNAHIQKKIGHKKLDKITISDVLNIKESEYLTNKSASYRNLLYRILNPIYKDAIARQEVLYNPCLVIDYEETEHKEKIEDRVEQDHLEIVRILYKAFKIYQARYSYQRDELNMYFLLLLLSGHRQHELILLKRENCYPEKGWIISPSEITKTKRKYKFPIPDEVINWIENKQKDELLFPNLKLKSIYYQFQNIIKYTPLKLNENKNFSPHDLRSLMMSLMITNCGISSVLADSCLEHKQDEMVERYMNITFEVKKEAFKRYWKLVRGESDKINDILIDHEKPLGEIREVQVPTTNKEDSKLERLERLSNLLLDDIITKEEFQKLKSEIING